MKRSIRFEIVVNVTILVVFALLLSALVVYKLLEQHLVYQEIENVKVFAFGVKENLETLIFRENLVQQKDFRIDQVVRKFLQNPRIYSMIVTDVRGNVLTHQGQVSEDLRENVKTIFRDEILPAMVGRMENIQVESFVGRSFGKSSLIRISVPLTVENKVWGGLALSMAMEGLKGVALNVLIYFFLYMVLVTAVLAIFGRLLMNQLVIQPVMQLVDGTRRIGRGDLSTQVEVRSHNELGELAKSLNEMSAQLRGAQTELIRNEKLATVGRLAAGVAHEIGNPIGAILGYAEILQANPADEQVKDFAARISQETARVDRIIRDLLGISRPSGLEFSAQMTLISVNEAVTRTVNLVAGQEIFKRIGITVKSSEEDPKIQGDLHQLQQVLINLFSNAANAMHQEGSLTLAVKTSIFNKYKEIEHQAGVLESVFLDETEVVVVSIRDNGPGISPAVIEHLFEPFFTTQEPGKGTGLGLFMVSRVLESMKARIGVENSPEGGAVFTLIFPRVQG